MTKVLLFQLMMYYKLPDFKNIDDFLAHLSRRMGKLRKGGIPDKEVAARKVLHDWNWYVLLSNIVVIGGEVKFSNIVQSLLVFKKIENDIIK